MKKHLTILVCMISLTALAYVNDNPTNVHIEVKGNNHFSEWNIPADMPDVYYNYVTGIITIVDYANVTYYVTIYDDWWNRTHKNPLW